MSSAILEAAALKKRVAKLEEQIVLLRAAITVLAVGHFNAEAAFKLVDKATDPEASR